MSFSLKQVSLGAIVGLLAKKEGDNFLPRNVTLIEQVTIIS
ncbi:MAG: hypothetical protein ACTSVI_15780 [Promethearchaeota archaeon]